MGRDIWETEVKTTLNNVAVENVVGKSFTVRSTRNITKASAGLRFK